MHASCGERQILLMGSGVPPLHPGVRWQRSKRNGSALQLVYVIVNAQTKPILEGGPPADHVVIGMLLERFGLWQARNERAGSFSRGMQQRLSLCRALLHEPELLVLDEPYSGLDDAGAELLDRELAELRAAATFLVSTHDPARLMALADTRLAFA